MHFKYFKSKEQESFFKISFDEETKTLRSGGVTRASGTIMIVDSHVDRADFDMPDPESYLEIKADEYSNAFSTALSLILEQNKE